MPDQIKRIDYFYITVPDKPGEGARILAVFQSAGVNLIGISAFPHGARKSQLDLIPEDTAAFARAAKAAKLKLSANTVAVHRANIMDELGIHKTAELVVYAIRNGLVNIT